MESKWVRAGLASVPILTVLAACGFVGEHDDYFSLERCESQTNFLKESLSFPVETPDITLDESGLEMLKRGNGWFVMNVGTVEHPLYRLGRIDPITHTIRLGMQVPAVSLLGPYTMPELSSASVYNPHDAFRVVRTEITEKELKPFFKMPAAYYPAVDDAYRARVLDRAGHMLQKPYTVSERAGLQSREIENLVRMVYDELEKEVRQPIGTYPDGSKCWLSHLADTSEDPTRARALVYREYPLLFGSSQDVKDWVSAHELGHAIDRVVDAREKFNALPAATRMRILEEFVELDQALEEVGKSRSVLTGPEKIADLYAYMLKDPSFVKEHAPQAYQFFSGLVGKDETLSKLIVFK